MKTPPGVFKCAKMTEQKKKTKTKTKNKNSPVLDLQRHLQMLVCLFMPQEIAILDL